MRGYFGPRVRRARNVAAPAAVAVQTISQDELRTRRQRNLPHVYRGGWSMTAELEAICEPLAHRVAAQTYPRVFWPAVDLLADAVHALVCAVAAMLARADAEARSRDMPVDRRSRAVRLLVELAEYPAAAQITDEHLAAGTWPALLVAMAQPHGERFAELLGRANPPGAMRGDLSVSERLERELREVDRAALSVARRLDAAAAHARAGRPSPADRSKAATDAARKELARLGIEA